MATNPFDKASRYVVKLDEPGFLAWALGLAPDQFRFRGWLDTRGIPFPGEAERTNDVVARLFDPAANLVPWAVAVEFQTEPDPLMFGRLLVYLGNLWTALKPDPGVGSRYMLGAVVVNLSGKGNATRRMGWPQAGLETTVVVRERNLAHESADELLSGISAGQWSRCLLPWIPLMTGGDDPGIIERWKAAAEGEPNARRRSELAGLALALSDAAGRFVVWKNSLRNWNMVTSQAVEEWMDEGRAKGRATSLIDVLEMRFGAVPPELAAAIHDTIDPTKLREWIKLAVKVASLDEFRKATGV